MYGISPRGERNTLPCVTCQPFHKRGWIVILNLCRWRKLNPSLLPHCWITRKQVPSCWLCKGLYGEITFQLKWFSDFCCHKQCLFVSHTLVCSSFSPQRLLWAVLLSWWHEHWTSGDLLSTSATVPFWANPIISTCSLSPLFNSYSVDVFIEYFKSK